jgi:hypothetical protein
MVPVHQMSFVFRENFHQNVWTELKTKCKCRFQGLKKRLEKAGFSPWLFNVSLAHGSPSNAFNTASAWCASNENPVGYFGAKIEIRSLTFSKASKLRFLFQCEYDQDEFDFKVALAFALRVLS